MYKAVDRNLSDHYSQIYNIPIEIVTRKTPNFRAAAQPDKLVFTISNAFDFMNPQTDEQVRSVAKLNAFIKKCVLEFGRFYQDRTEDIKPLITTGDLQSMTSTWAAKMNLPSMKISMRQHEHHWGEFLADYSTGAGTIMYNKDLLFMTRDMAEYVVVHELCHALEWWQIWQQFKSRPDQARFVWRHREAHSPDFWRLLTRYMSDWSTRRADLNKRYTDIYKTAAPSDG